MDAQCARVIVAEDLTPLLVSWCILMLDYEIQQESGKGFPRLKLDQFPAQRHYCPAQRCITT